jgi:uncharacterized DUF497 family protein
LHVLVFTERDNVVRVISLRHADKKDVERHVTTPPHGQG